MTENFWSQQRVYITGGKGFLGAHIAKLCLERGARVCLADIHQIGSGLECMRELCGEILDSSDLVTEAQIDVTSWCPLDVFQDGYPTIIFHMAGQSHINAAQKDPLLTFDVNVEGTLNVVKEAGRRSPGSSRPLVIVASSNHVYGPQTSILSATEESPLNQLDAYGGSKAAADIAARSLGMALGVPVLTMRNVNAFGPADPHVTHLVTGTIKSLLAGEATVLRGDGSAMKQYLHAEDVAEAYLVAAAALSSNPSRSGKAFNVAPRCGPVSAAWMILKISEIYGKAGKAFRPIKFLKGPEQCGYYEDLDGSEFTRLTGWSPWWTLEAGLVDTLEWYEEHGFEWRP